MKPTILITGGAGYIGSVGVETLLKEGFSVVILDDLSTGHTDSLFDKIPFYNGSIGDPNILKTIFVSHKIDLVLHIAGAALVEESMKNPMKYFDINFSQGIKLLDTMLQFNVNKIVFSSTCAVYGIPNNKDIPIKEETKTKPVNIYGQSKLLFENALKWYKANFSLDFIALRYFNVAGASENRFEQHDPETHLIPLILRASKDINYKLQVYGNDYDTKDGTAIRDYIHVVDLINAHIRAINILLENKQHNNIYNVGYGHGYSVLEIINAIKQVTNKDIQYTIAQRRPGDPPVLIADSNQIKKDLQWVPEHNDINTIIESVIRLTN